MDALHRAGRTRDPRDVARAVALAGDAGPHRDPARDGEWLGRCAHGLAGVLRGPIPLGGAPSRGPSTRSASAPMTRDDGASRACSFAPQRGPAPLRKSCPTGMAARSCSGVNSGRPIPWAWSTDGMSAPRGRSRGCRMGPGVGVLSTPLDREATADPCAGSAVCNGRRCERSDRHMGGLARRRLRLGSELQAWGEGAETGDLEAVVEIPAPG